MVNSIALFAVASATLASALTTQSVGGASIVNYCTDDITMTNVPAATAGGNNPPQVTSVLKANNVGSESQYFQHYIMLDVSGGWSMKLTDPNNATNVGQFEYTYTSDSGLWYDMSFVNYESTTFPAWSFACSEDSADPTDLAYLYATDDANGMQKNVSATATVTLHLCPALSTAAATGGYIASTAATATAAATTAEATTAEATTAPVYTAPSSSAAAPSTTFSTRAATSTSTDNAEPTEVTTKTWHSKKPVNTILQEDDNGVEVVTEYATQVVTAVVTETAHANRRRHEHRHPHAPHH